MRHFDVDADSQDDEQSPACLILIPGGECCVCDDVWDTDNCDPAAVRHGDLRPLHHLNLLLSSPLTNYN